MAPSQADRLSVATTTSLAPAFRRTGRTRNRRARREDVVNKENRLVFDPFRPADGERAPDVGLPLIRRQLHLGARGADALERNVVEGERPSPPTRHRPTAGIG